MFLKKFKKVVLLFFLLTTVYASKDFPKLFSRCDRHDKNFELCLSQAIYNAITKLTVPLDGYGLPSLDPLKLDPDVSVAIPLADVKYTNYQVHGLTDIEKAPKVSMDFATNTLSIDITFPELRHSMDFSIKTAENATAQIEGTGNGQIMTKDDNYRILIQLDEVEYDGQKHYKVQDVSVELNPKLLVYKVLTFVGNNLTPEALTKLLNENKDVIDKQMTPECQLVWATLIGQWFNYFLSQVTVEELWGEG